MEFLIIGIFIILILFVLFDFIKFLVKKDRFFNPVAANILDSLVIIIIPLLYLLLQDFGKDNECCHDTATFSPDHRMTIYTYIGLCITAYFYSRNRKEIAPPVLEVILNGILLIGVILNVALAYHIDFFGLFGNIPIALLFTIPLIENQQKIIQNAVENEYAIDSKLNKISWQILTSKPIIKYPILLLLCIPIILILTTVLLLFGQKPNSSIKAFTDTYRHGFSQLNHLCKNVECGGHYLCSVAANGHQNIVKPERLGIRNGGLIICNRQLLISNAFEELIQEKAPIFHRFVRNHYNKVGNVIHRYYYLFENKWLSDLIYLMMKPLEWLFLVVLYVFDQNPENRISKQYL
ncbi:MAG: hypothetical protein P1U70_09645 [Saprospiraceae bacterium]|jgi:uncharacterized membrane protein|nr:hypothetical protein [Saprospiraceae bacterium]